MDTTLYISVDAIFFVLDSFVCVCMRVCACVCVCLLDAVHAFPLSFPRGQCDSCEDMRFLFQCVCDSVSEREIKKEAFSLPHFTICLIK